MTCAPGQTILAAPVRAQRLGSGTPDKSGACARIELGLVGAGGVPKHKPKALDLFCCAGGAGMGMHRAGFAVTGCDIEAQRHYPFALVLGDALAQDLTGYDFVWASPPCQHHSRMTGCRDGLREKYPDLIAATRAKLKAWGGPWIIENVVGAPLQNPVMLCGAMFGLATYRHRIFESNVPLTAPTHPRHTTPTSKAGHWKPGTLISVAGNCAPMSMAREAMGIDWMPRANLVEAIPPAFSEYLCAQILSSLGGGGAELAGDGNATTRSRAGSATAEVCGDGQKDV